MSKGKKGTIPVPDGQVGTCHPARNEWNLKKTALERKGVGDSRDLLIVEITIPDFLFKKKKSRSTFFSTLPQENNQSFVP